MDEVEKMNQRRDAWVRRLCWTVISVIAFGGASLGLFLSGNDDEIKIIIAITLIFGILLVNICFMNNCYEKLVFFKYTWNLQTTTCLHLWLALIVFLWYMITAVVVTGRDYTLKLDLIFMIMTIVCIPGITEFVVAVMIILLLTPLALCYFIFKPIVIFIYNYIKNFVHNIYQQPQVSPGP